MKRLTRDLDHIAENTFQADKPLITSLRIAIAGTWVLLNGIRDHGENNPGKKRA
jgi:hypothetical protein